MVDFKIGKPTSEPYYIRGSGNITMSNGGTSATASVVMNTHLDALNHEILVVWGADINHRTLGTQISNVINSVGVLGQSATISGNITLQTGKGSVTGNEPWEPAFIAGNEIIISADAGTLSGFQGFYVNETRFPDQTQDKAGYPLAIVVDDEIALRFALECGGQATFTSDSVAFGCRVLVQRFKADLATYSALLAGNF